MRYYRSTDTVITTSDTAVGTDAVTGLAASDSTSESVDLTAPPDPGTYYYGACVDSVANESDTTDNCSASVIVNVTGIPFPPSSSPPPLSQYPDLEVGMPTVDDSTLDTGSMFTLSATVRNDGGMPVQFTVLRYYRSSDATITIFDTEEGTDFVEALPAFGTSAESTELTAPSTAGVYYYGACVDPVTNESDTTDNCSASVRVNVTATPPPPPRTTSPGLDIDIVYGDPQPSAVLKAEIDTAATIWESAIINDLTDVDFARAPRNNPCTGDTTFSGYVDDLRIYIYFEDIDGESGTLAKAGICTRRNVTGSAVLGRIILDSSDMNRLSTTRFRNLVLHEIAHVLGFGTWWNNLQNRSVDQVTLEPIDPKPDTHFPGTNAVAAFDAAGGSNYTGGKVPVENENGGVASWDNHWRVSVMAGELMTLNSGGALGAFSAITIQSMADLGYTVDTSVADAYTVSLPDTSTMSSFSRASLRFTADTQASHCKVEQLDVDFVP